MIWVKPKQMMEEYWYHIGTIFKNTKAKESDRNYNVFP